MIIKTLDQFKVEIPTAASVENFADVLPYILSAEMWLKNHILGDELYTFLADDESSTGENDELLRLCSSVISNHAYWDAIPFLDVIHTDSGFAVISANNKVPASKERVERLRAQCLLRRDSEIELLISYLEGNEQYWDMWKSTEAFGNMFDSLIPTLEIFRKYHHIADRATLDKLRGAIVTVQNTTVAETISKAYVDELVEAQKDNDFTPYDEAILHMLRDAIVKLSLAWGIESMSINIDTNGAITLKGQDNFVGAIAADARLQMYKQSFEKAGKQMLDRVVDYMVNNIDDYETFADSNEYAARITSGFENSEDSPIFNSIW